MGKSIVAALVIALAIASVFAIWPVVADAPWEAGGSRMSEGALEESDPNLPASTRLQVQDAVMEAISLRCRAIMQRIDSQFLGGSTWEATIELRLPVSTGGLPRLGEPQLYDTVTAIFRIQGQSLTVKPLSAQAQRCIQ